MQISTVGIKGFHQISDLTTYCFKSFNYICGKNGAGKSTILQAIQLAILGYIPGTNKQKSAIYSTHANKDGAELSIQINFDDGSFIRRSYNRRGKDVVEEFDTSDDLREVCTDDLVGEIGLPIFDYLAFIDMSANKLKDWFIQFLPKHSIDIDWDSELSGVLPEYLCMDDIEDILLDAKHIIAANPDNTSEAIQTINSELSDILKVKKAELQQLEGAIKTLIFYSDISGDVDKTEIENKQIELRQKIYAASTNDTMRRQNIQLENKLSELKANIPDIDTAVIQSNIDELGIKLKELKDVGLTTRDTEVKLTQELHNIDSVIDGNGICPYTNKACSEISDKLSDYAKTAVNLRNELDKISDSLQSQREAYSSLHNELQSKVLELDEYNAKLNKINEIRSQIVDIKDDDVNVDTLQSQLDEISDILTKILANEKYEESIETFNRDKVQLTREIEVLKEWVKLTDTNGLQSKILVEGSQFDLLESTMNALGFFNEPIHFNIGSKNSFSFGIMRNDTYLSYNQLSSGEKCLFTLNLLVALTQLSDNKLSVIIADDILDHLDKTNFFNIIKILSSMNNNIQMILAGVQILTDQYNNERINVITI